MKTILDYDLKRLPIGNHNVLFEFTSARWICSQAKGSLAISVGLLSGLPLVPSLTIKFARVLLQSCILLDDHAYSKHEGKD